MTAAQWLATGQTVVFLALCGFGWWLSGRQLRTENNSEVAVEHAVAAAQYANRAAMDSREMLDVLSRYWNELRDTQPETRPYPVVGPDTVPETQAVRLIADVDLAWEVARLEQIMRGDKPSPRPRKART